MVNWELIENVADQVTGLKTQVEDLRERVRAGDFEPVAKWVDETLASRLFVLDQELQAVLYADDD